MDHLGIGRIIIMPPPFSMGHRGRFEVNALIPLKEKYPDRNPGVSLREVEFPEGN
jgi:hypothetical protein